MSLGSESGGPCVLLALTGRLLPMGNIEFRPFVVLHKRPCVKKPKLPFLTAQVETTQAWENCWGLATQMWHCNYSKDICIRFFLVLESELNMWSEIVSLSCQEWMQAWPGSGDAVFGTWRWGPLFQSGVCVWEGQSLTEFSTVPSHSYRPWKHKALIPDFPYPDLDPKPRWDPSSGSQGWLLDLVCLLSREKTPTAMLSFQITYSKTEGLFLWMMIY